MIEPQGKMIFPIVLDARQVKAVAEVLQELGRGGAGNALLLNGPIVTSFDHGLKAMEA